MKPIEYLFHNWKYMINVTCHFGGLTDAAHRRALQNQVLQLIDHRYITYKTSVNVFWNPNVSKFVLL